MDLIGEILKVANSKVGIAEEKQNELFTDNSFNEFLETSGWNEGDPYCAYFAEAVYREAYVKSGNSQIAKKLEKLFSGSAVQTYNNFLRSDDDRWEVTSIPKPGALIVWQRYENNKPTWKGHIGIVEAVNFANNMIFTIEGNTNSAGGRLGDGVYRKSRELNFRTKFVGLVLLGFINPLPI